MDTRSLRGKNAIITGAAQGIGRAIVLEFLRDGANVLGVDRNADGVAALRDEAQSMPGRFEAMGHDITGDGAAEATLEQARQVLGSVDILVNNAGIETRSPLQSHDDAAWERVLQVNLTAPFRLSRALCGELQSRRGAIVNITSVAVFGFAGQAAYDASKAGLQTLTRSLAVELGSSGVRVNSVAPGFIATPMVEAFQDLKSFGQKVTRGIPAGRMGRPEEVAAAVSWLASDAASYVTGQSLLVDGGWFRQ